jgi:HEAT repeat protein
VTVAPLPAPEEMPTALLVRLALRQVRDHPDEPAPFLVALHARPTREVFDVAVALARGEHADRRELGVRILRELGPERSDGPRPYSAETIPVLLDRLRDEADPRVLGWIVSALGYHGGSEALPAVSALAGHPDAWVRFCVAAALPSLVDPAGIEAAAAAALIRLCRDPEADIRFYALYAVTQEVAGIDPATLARLTGELLADSDDQVRAMATDHHRP